MPVEPQTPDRSTARPGPAALLSQLTQPGLSLFRIVVGLLFCTHGASTLFGWAGNQYGASGLGWWAAVIQLVCGGLVLIGFITRPAAVLSSGSMAFAYFTVHQPHALLPVQNGGEPAALYCWAMLAIAVAGAGPLALDALLRGRQRGSQRVTNPVPEFAED